MYLVLYPHSKLRSTAVPVTQFGYRLEKIVLGMKKIMLENKGIGIAAQQCGLDKAIILCYDINSNETHIMCNPTIISMSGSQLEAEGCLSFPRVFKEVERPEKVTVSYNNWETGEIKQLEARGLLAQCVVHEYEHLQGILLIDTQQRKMGGINESQTT